MRADLSKTPQQREVATVVRLDMHVYSPLLHTHLSETRPYLKLAILGLVQSLGYNKLYGPSALKHLKPADDIPRDIWLTVSLVVSTGSGRPEGWRNDHIT